LRGSVFPKSDSVWKAINIEPLHEADARARTEGGTRILKSLGADIWLLQEIAYSSSGLTSEVTMSDVQNRLAQHMRTLTGKPWSVRCGAHGGGLCTMIRSPLRFDGESFSAGSRAFGNRVVLADGSKVFLVNVHFMSDDHAKQAAQLIKSTARSDTVFVGGDFNNGTGGRRHREIDAVSGVFPIKMAHARDARTTHLSRNVVDAPPFRSTGGQVAFGSGPTGQAVVTSVDGNTIDHFFMRDSSKRWRIENRFILNTLILSPSTLRDNQLTPLDVVVEPDKRKHYFRDFMSRGIVYELPSDRGMGHDHLPMIIDFEW
jgi:endonuclease/exonuclease/phosphatase family metal-dependent hydrolase